MRAMALLAGIVFTTALQGQGTAVVSGVVRDEVGNAIGATLVVIDPDSLMLRTRTDASGRFRIPGVPIGRFEVRVVRIGFRPHSRMIDVAGRELDITVELSSVPVPLDTVAVRASRPGLYGVVVTRGIALLPHEPRPLRGARIEVLNEPHSTTAGVDGRFAMPRLGGGGHSVVVSMDGYGSRLLPVFVPPDAGVEITVVLDSTYADYQRADDDQVRGVSWRMRRATNPSAFVPLQEIDQEAKHLRDALRYSYSLLSRGLIITGGCIYLNGKPRPELALTDIPPEGIIGIEVYPPNTLLEGDRLAPVNPGTPCGGVTGGPWGTIGIGRGRAGRIPMRERGNRGNVIVIWTR